MVNRFKKMINRPGGIGLWILNRKIFRKMPDNIYISLKYRCILKKWPNLNNPKNINEKIQWLKLNDKNNLYPQLVDKYGVREYIKDKIGADYLIPLLGVWDSANEIEWEKLPKKFVLKCTHGSHTNIVCLNKDSLDKKEAELLLNKWLKNDQTYYYGREWPYKYVKPRIIAEEYIESTNEGGPVDYKFMCFDGIADNVMLCIDRLSGKPAFYHFSKEWKFLRYQESDLQKPLDFSLEKPKMLDEMFALAEKLAAPFKFVRVDLYCENNRIYFGELTFYPQSGFDTDFTEETSLYLGNKLKI